MAKMNVKKGDEVIVIAGKDKGKTGKVVQVIPSQDKVVVEGVNVATKHQAPRRQGDEGGIIHVEIPMYVSKVQLVCPKCGKATRVGHRINDGEKVRVCRKCGEEI